MPSHPDRVRRNYQEDNPDICPLCGEALYNLDNHQVIKTQVNKDYNLIIDCFTAGKSTMMGPFSA